MASPRKHPLADFSGWNMAFVLAYLLNAINITIEYGDPVFGPGAIALMGVQSGFVTLLAATRKPLTAVLSTLAAAAGYYLIVAPGIANGTMPWNPGLVIGIPAFHVLFSVVGSVLTGSIRGRVAEMDTRVGTTAISGIAVPGTANWNQGSRVKFSALAALTCLAYCLVHLVAWFGSDAMMAHVLISLPVMPTTMALLLAFFFTISGPPRNIYNAALTHHVIEDADHTVRVTIGKVSVHLCTRCTAMITGLLFSMYAFVTLRLDIDPFLAFFLDIFIPAPVFIDWGLQRFGYRKSKTWKRVVTGVLTGLGFALIPQASPDFSIHAMVVLMAYFVVFFVIYFLSARRGYYEDDEVDFSDGLTGSDGS